MDTFYRREQAVASMQDGNAFSLLWSEAEARDGHPFFLIKTPDTIHDLIKKSIERGVVMHFHEALFSVSKKLHLYELS